MQPLITVLPIEKYITVFHKANYGLHLCMMSFYSSTIKRLSNQLYDSLQNRFHFRATFNGCAAGTTSVRDACGQKWAWRDCPLLFPTCSFCRRATPGTAGIWRAKFHLDAYSYNLNRAASWSGTGTATQVQQQHIRDQELYNKEVSCRKSSTHDTKIELDKMDQASVSFFQPKLYTFQ